MMDGRALQSSCDGGPCVGYDSPKCKRGSKLHMAMDILSLLLAVQVTPADEQERAHVRTLCKQVQQATGHSVELAWHTGEQARQAAQDNGIVLQRVNLPEAKKGFVPLPKRRMLVRSFE